MHNRFTLHLELQKVQYKVIDILYRPEVVLTCVSKHAGNVYVDVIDRLTVNHGYTRFKTLIIECNLNEPLLCQKAIFQVIGPGWEF